MFTIYNYYGVTAMVSSGFDDITKWLFEDEPEKKEEYKVLDSKNELPYYFEMLLSASMLCLPVE